MGSRSAGDTTTGRRRRRAPWLVAPTLVVLGACGALEQGALAPESGISRELRDLFSISFWIAVAVAAIVLGLLAFAIFRPRRRESRMEDGTVFVTVGGLVVPSVILLGLMVLTFVSLAALPTGDAEMEIEVTGHQFWWEVYYPEHDFETANEMHIPVGTRIAVTLRSADVLHSFWVPELAGKKDLVPGRENILIIEADNEGTWQGQCAEYCGLQHAHMAFLVIAESEDSYEEWARAQAEPAAVEDREGERVFERHACAGCHTIRGTDADGEVGPDLTHLASRETLAAATIPNTRGHLGGWVVNSQTIKPGNEMPPITTLEPEELHTLLDYLESLE